VKACPVRRSRDGRAPQYPKSGRFASGRWLGHTSLVWLDALTIKVRDDGRVVNVHALIATGVNAVVGRMRGV